MCYSPSMDSPGERLTWARRVHAGIKSIAEAARKFRAHPQNWADHEANRRGISPQQALKYGRWLKVSAGWILTGQGAAERVTIRLMGYVGAGAQVFPFDAEQLDEIDAPVGAQEGDVAFIIRGVSMGSVFSEGGLIVVRPCAEVSECLYRLAIVDLDDGRRLFKQVTPGSKPGLHTLLSQNDAPIVDVRVTAAARFRSYVEPD